MIPNKATLFIISAPSGAGKTSLVNALLKATPNITVSISYTTRPKRINEKNHVAYHFIDEEGFQEMVAKNAFLEHATVFSYHYGTPRQWVEEKLAQGIDVILEIDWQGAQQIREHMPECVGIFIIPPSISVLKKRLLERGQDEMAVIEKRLASAKAEMSHLKEFDYLIINDDFETALADLTAVIQANRLRIKKQIEKNSEMIRDLLA